MEFNQALPIKWNSFAESSTGNKKLPLNLRWKNLQAQVEKGEFSLADLFFAESILKKEGNEKSALFLATLFASARTGHLCLKVENSELLQGAKELSNEIKDSYLHAEDNRWYLKRNWEIELLFVTEWRRLRGVCPKLEIPVKSLEKKLQNLYLEKEQEEAIKKAATCSLSFIAGGPGTGKTYTAALLLALFKDILPQKIIAVAPTGKATANLREKLATVCEAHTLHSALKKKLFFSADVILVDEGSMVDAKVMASLFSQIKTGSRLILMGDPFQLPPVETGNLFADLVTSTFSEVTTLNKCRRAELQEIIEMAAKVKAGEWIEYSPLPDIKTLVTLLLEKALLADEMSVEESLINISRFRILTPLRQGSYGTESLNRLLFQAHASHSTHPRIPIMICENHAELGLFNGDVGVLGLKEEEAFFSGGRRFPMYLLPRYEWAYLLSVHKSQGSEYEEVKLLLPEGAERFGREVLYTAITRARKKASVLSEKRTLMEMLQKSTPRLSGILNAD